MKKIYCVAIALVLISAGANVFAQETEPAGEPQHSEASAPQRIDWLSKWQPEKRWYIGFYAGFSHNTLYTGGAELLEYFKTYEPGYGWTIGLPVRFKIFNWLAVQAEPTFITKNYTMAYTGQYGKYLNLYSSYTNSFINFPIMLNFELPVMKSPLSLFANTGAYMGFWAASNLKGRTISMTMPANPFEEKDVPVASFNEKYEFDPRYDSRFDGGLLLGLGVQFDFKPASIFAEWRYNYALADMRKQMQRNQAPYKNDTWTIHAGVLFNSEIFNAFRGGR
jgi:hypothetical protein